MKTTRILFLMLLTVLICGIKVAALDYEPDIILLKLSSGVVPSDIEFGVPISSSRPLYPSSKKLSLKAATQQATWYVIRLEQVGDIEAICKILRSKPGVLSAEPNYKEKKAQQSITSKGQEGKVDVKIPETDLYDIQAIPITHEIIVAVVDSGVDYTHPDLKNAIYKNQGEIPNNGSDDDNNGYIDDVNGWNFYNSTSGGGSNAPMDDSTGHGTHVAGIIAAQKNDQKNGCGVNPGCKILPIKVLQDDLTSNTAVASAIHYAVNMGVKVINCSFGLFDSQLLKDAIVYAQDNGVVIVAAAGNNFSTISNQYPALYPGVIVVGATDQSGTRLGASSNFGDRVDFAEYGQLVFSTIPGGLWTTKSGTSMATPMVSGIIARLLGNDQNLTKSQIYSKLSQYSVPLSDGTNMGHGRIRGDLLAASYVTKKVRYVDINLGNRGRGILETYVYSIGSNVVRKVAKSLYFPISGKQYSLNKELR